ncbi:Spermidine N(1)-acetyltransferase [Pandoraea anapnoica]|uniref:Spermidine N(1)-acetyltransferase n=1 Tax=Pandoraea anapnoica TaxID=2508301 RepID=A0A5E5A8V2_9BURK|nr:GNAT family N-acetyltransferase [Pandoraea anapnoica]VVE68965.1 Spermidine N(1)-acetyltransferase [Pandoraea anapnoica]
MERSPATNMHRPANLLSANELTPASRPTKHLWEELSCLFLTDKALDASSALQLLVEATSASQQVTAFPRLAQCVAPAYSDALHWRVRDGEPPNFHVGNHIVGGCTDWMSLTDAPISLPDEDRVLLRNTLRNHALPTSESGTRSNLNLILEMLDTTSRLETPRDQTPIARDVTPTPMVRNASLRPLNIQVRELTSDDAPIFQNLRLHALQRNRSSFEANLEEEATLSATSAWTKVTMNPAGIILGAFDGGKLVGTVGLRFALAQKRSHIGTVWGVYVHETAARRGVGRQLLLSVIAIARSMPQLVRLSLTVNTASTTAVSLYESLGFVKFGRDPDALRCDGQSYDRFHMHLPLDSTFTPT